jgi:DNA-directed RNA polymerase specialized sigma24 family protein
MSHLAARLAPSGNRDAIVRRALVQVWRGRGDAQAPLDRDRLLRAVIDATERARRMRWLSLGRDAERIEFADTDRAFDVEAALAELPRSAQQVADAVYFAGLSDGDAAVVLNMSTSMVSSAHAAAERAVARAVGSADPGAALADAGARWRDSEPPAPTLDASLFGSTRRRPRWTLSIVLAAAVAVVAGGGAFTFVHFTRDAMPPLEKAFLVRDGDTVGVTGKVLLGSDGSGRVCLDESAGASDEPDPDTSCEHTFTVAGVIPDQLANRQTVDGFTVGFAYLQGTWHDGSITVTRQGPPRADDWFPDWGGPPCPAPPGGWSTERVEDAQAGQSLSAYVHAHPDQFAGMWGASVDDPSRGDGPSISVAVVGVVRDLDAVRPLLHQMYSGNLCVVKSPHSLAEVSYARNLLLSHEYHLGILGGDYALSEDDPKALVMRLNVTVVDQTVLDLIRQAGPDVVEVHPWVKKVGHG